MKKVRKTYAIDPAVSEAVKKQAEKTERSESYVANKILSEKLLPKK